MWALLLVSLGWASVVDRVVALAGSEIVLASDVALDAELTAFDPSSSPFWRRPGERRQIEAAVVRTAAGDVALYVPTEEEVRERMARLREAMGEREAWDAFLARWGFQEAGLAGVIRRRLVVEAYLARNITVPPDDPGWQGAADALIAQLAGRMRVREIPCEGCAPAAVP